MFKTSKEAGEFADVFSDLYKKSGTQIRAAICCPYTQLMTLKTALAGSGIGLGAQNVHFAEEGAYTGEISLAMLTEIGVDYCIVGHSERRSYFNETDESINKKLHTLLGKSAIRPILCVGESLEEREEGRAEAKIADQLKKDLEGLSKDQVARLVIAYEPIWAIGTGKTAKAEDAGAMCRFIRLSVEKLYDEDTCDSVIIQYGGSVKAANAAEIMAQEEIDGALVGGASLDPHSFMDIINF